VIFMRAGAPFSPHLLQVERASHNETLRSESVNA